MTPAFDYEFNDLLTAYGALGLRPGGLVYVGADLASLMRYAKPGREPVLAAHLDAIRHLIGPGGTVFVPTASLHICNTETVFDPVSTPSSEMGVFAEYVRTRPEAVRSFHPFWSVSGIGPRAHEFLDDVSRHAYGYRSVWQRFVEADVLALNIGKPPHDSISIIHHIETVVGIPYRYTKEFLHPVRRGGETVREPFYLSVLYRECDIVRDHNRKIFDNFNARATMNRAAVGRRGFAWSFSLREFFHVTANLLVTNPYAWLERPPAIRPFQS